MNKETLTIVQLLSSSLGGAAEHVYNLVTSTEDTSINYKLVSPDDGGHIIEDFQAKGFPVEIINVAQGFSLKTLWGLVKFIRGSQAQIVHCHGFRAGLFGRVAARLASPKIKTILTVHGFHYMHYQNRLKRIVFLLLERILTRITDFVIAVSDTDLNNLLRLKCAKINKSIRIFNGIDVPKICSLKIDKTLKKQELGVSSDAKYVIGTVARLRPEKGVGYFLKAIPEIIRLCPHCFFLIVGDGEQRTEFKILVEKLGLENKVAFLGNRSDVLEILRILDVFVFPSLWEGLPIAPMEAMAVGVPVVATDVSGNRDLIGSNGGNGLLVPTKNPEAITRAVLRLLTEDKLAEKLIASAKEQISEKFTVRIMTDKTVQQYKNIIQSH
ncbi:glycosyltransferase family 4 protein [Candidatus Margulisiibacteriota bacterium]